MAINYHRSQEHPLFHVADDEPLKSRGIMHPPLISLAGLPSLALVNIFSRLPLDDLFINLFMLCKAIRKLIIELIGEQPHYFTKIYAENYPGRYFLVIKGDARSYFAELRRPKEIDTSFYFFRHKIEYAFASTRWTRQNLRCRIGKIQMSCYFGPGRCIIASCNGIFCLRKRDLRNPGIVVLNPIFGDEDDNEFIPEPKYLISKYQISDFSSNLYIGKRKVDRRKELVLVGSCMGFGCTNKNRDKFKVIIVKNYVCDSLRYDDFSSKGHRIVKIGIDEHPCVKSTCEIITLGADRNWRILPEKDSWFYCCHSHTFVSFEGIFFWIGHCSRNDGGLDASASQCVCVAFDIEKEKARSIKLPPQFRHIDDYYGGLVVLGKNLCLYDNTTYQNYIMLWKMTKTTTIEDCTWSVEFVIHKRTLVSCSTDFIAYTHTYFIPIMKMPSGKIMMFCRLSSVACIYDPKTKTSHYIGNKRSRGERPIPYTPNFASLKDVINRGIDPTHA